ncbi:hypothetical protein POJ06DRAFT_270043 [Lipomyces tetrasporus]|uniref:Uncharacterized protein n=1 Tax=Lipomyces tetrasporus TaxID=54092 RepID=A0AAD7QP15_9ASCO|nr:uncharacterized protein POJ06DRAFT_270043 [Lipomyces tetrasporus]KAJ8098967.1 hypothetical protein POJ06DRAFT_270043 [Lipomyces tetrasporus]
MCEYLELEFPLLSLAEGQWAAVVYLSGYFRRAHGSISGSRLSADYQVRVVDEDSDEYVAEETLQDTQSEADGEITDVPQGGDGSVENEPQSIRISATSCRQSYRALTPTLKGSESRKLEAAKREKQLANLERARSIKLRQSYLAKRNL